MRKNYILIVLLLIVAQCQGQSNDSIMIRKIYDEALTNSKCMGWLDFLSNQIGGRLSGSLKASQAVTFVQMELTKLNVDQVTLQEVMVPHWVRGNKEQAWVTSNTKKTMVSICALGGNVATPKGGLIGEVVEVYDWLEMEKLGRDVISGKIVFMNHPMNPKFINTFEAYGEAAKYRYGTAAKAAALGAKGVVVRSMTLSLDDYPHTGAMGYVDSIGKIPACAISTIGAERFSAIIKKDKKAQFGFSMSPQSFPDTLSHNVIGEIVGSEFPNEVILVGGHLDAWELGDGAHDDGAGVVQAMEVLHILKALNVKPKRTIRCVAFMNEENGGKGGEKYAGDAKKDKRKTIAAIESDAGGFSPRGFSFKGDSLIILKAMSWKKMFEPYLLFDWRKGYGGADINHLHDQGTLLIGFMPDSQRYFDLHHAATDTFDKINKRELELGAAAMASLAWLLSEYGVK
ncbi:MAG: M20/M25/M40 family metallo-hydrolase [Bacteroidetes bacterium]|nr:M20/M25/M40 family metallo-hydrolase [Bacteroidota bacterium]